MRTQWDTHMYLSERCVTSCFVAMCMYTNTHTHTHICIHTRIHAYTHTDTHTLICARPNDALTTCFVVMRIYTNIHMNTRIHTLYLSKRCVDDLFRGDAAFEEALDLTFSVCVCMYVCMYAYVSVSWRCNSRGSY